MKIRLERVHYMPKALEPGILYVSDTFETAAHLCACGCGSKIRTPLGPTEWSLSETPAGPSLRPSIGNWQQACRSHYCITQGEIRWSGQWTDAQIEAGRRREQDRRAAYYEALHSRHNRLWARVWRWLKSLIR